MRLILTLLIRQNGELHENDDQISEYNDVNAKALVNLVELASLHQHTDSDLFHKYS